MDHAYNITINSRAKIGKNVTMYKGATIGCDTEGAPVIGDLAYIGLNAVIVGKVTIGDDVLCAANSFINFLCSGSLCCTGKSWSYPRKEKRNSWIFAKYSEAYR